MTSFELANVAKQQDNDETDNIYKVDSIAAPSDVSYFDVDEEEALGICKDVPTIEH